MYILPPPFMDEVLSEEIVKKHNLWNGWEYSRWEFSGWEFSGGNFPGGNFPRTLSFRETNLLSLARRQIILYARKVFPLSIFIKYSIHKFLWSKLIFFVISNNTNNSILYWCKCINFFIQMWDKDLLKTKM